MFVWVSASLAVRLQRILRARLWAIGRSAYRYRRCSRHAFDLYRSLSIIYSQSTARACKWISLGLNATFRMHLPLLGVELAVSSSGCGGGWVTLALASTVVVSSAPTNPIRHTSSNGSSSSRSRSAVLGIVCCVLCVCSSVSHTRVE